jgi:hypothetical protein
MQVQKQRTNKFDNEICRSHNRKNLECGVVDVTQYVYAPVTYIRSQWPCGLRLGLRVRIPPGSWMSMSCACCDFSGTGLCVGLITRPGES